MLTVIVLGLATKGHASTFIIDGKEVTKGEAIRALALNPKVKVIKQDQVVLSDAGTLKNKPKKD